MHSAQNATIHGVRIGVLSPGRMGVTLAHSLSLSGHETFFASENRSRATIIRAHDFGIKDLKTRKNVFNECEVVFSIISGDTSAVEMAQDASNNMYKGIYVDANSLMSIETDKMIEAICLSSNVRYVEASILAWPIYDIKEESPFSRQIHISGPEEESIRKLFSYKFWEFIVHNKHAKLFRRQIVFGE